MSERKRVEIYRRLPFDGRPSLEKRRIWELTERSLSYEGIEGRILSYSDGISDILVFTGFPPGEKREKLWRSIRSLRRESLQGRYEVKATKEAEKAKIIHSPEKGFGKVWQDLLLRVLPQRPGEVILGEAKEIREFTLQDLLVEN